MCENYTKNSLVGRTLLSVNDDELMGKVCQLEIHQDHLRVDMSDKIGGGEFGVVYKGLLSVDDTWRSVAVKVIKGEKCKFTSHTLEIVVQSCLPYVH